MYDLQVLQTEYLAHLIKHKKRVTLCLRSGYRLNGVLTGMTPEAVFFKDSITEIFYKKMIAIIFPLERNQNVV